MRDFTSNIDDDAIMNARADRSRPDMDPGMDDDDGWESLGSSDSDSPWGGSFGGGGDDDFSSFGRPSFGGGGDRFGGGFGGGGGFGNDFGGGSRFGNNSGFSSQYGSPNQMQQQQNQQMMNPEDKFWGAVATGGKEGLNFITALVKSFKNFNLIRRKDFGKNMLISGGFIFVASLILTFVLDPYLLNFAIAGALSAGLGVILFMSSMERLANGEGVEPEPMPEPAFEPSWDDEPEWEPEDEPEEEPILSQSVLDRIEKDNNDWDNPFDREDERETIELSTRDKDDLIQELEEKIRTNQVDTRMINKQYLYDMMLSTLQTRTPNYARETELDPDSREFLAYCEMVKSAAEVIGSGKNLENMPEVTEVVDKLFYTLITIRRPKWINESNIDKLVREIVNVCALDKRTREIDKSITGSGTVAGNEAYIKINKGETAMVTLKDIYLSDKVRDEIVKGKMKMPLAFGINAEGDEIIRDFKDVHALLVSGAPRSGKTWFVKTLIAQLMMFKKPSEFEFYIIDAKTVTSDYYHLVTPHIRDFLTTDEEIITLLRHLCNEEANRREQLFYEKGGVQNIEDFHKKNPFEKMPYILVVMDEVITISNRMDKEMKNEFMSLLKMFTSRLPSLGIRILMVPHVVKNEVLSKTITDMIPYRISVKGDPEHIEGVTGATPKQFPMKLNHMGDIAFKIDNSGVLFAHTPIISDTNQGFDEFFEYLTDFWLHIEPESVKGSKLEKEILSGIRNEDTYSALTDDYKSEIKEERARIKAARNATRVQKPVINNSNGSESQKRVEKPKSAPKAPKMVADEDSSEHVVSRIRGDNYDYNYRGTTLSDGETKDLLKDAHKGIGKKTNVTYDDTLV